MDHDGVRPPWAVGWVLLLKSKQGCIMGDEGSNSNCIFDA